MALGSRICGSQRCGTDPVGTHRQTLLKVSFSLQWFACLLPPPPHVLLTGKGDRLVGARVGEGAIAKAGRILRRRLLLRGHVFHVLLKVMGGGAVDGRVLGLV